MANYRYTALKPDGRETRGKISADDEHAAASLLQATHLHLLDLRPQAEREWWGTYELHLSHRLKPDVLAVWSRQLATLIRAGVPILQSLRIMARQSETRSLRKIMDQVVERVQSGEPLSVALSEHQNTFPGLLIQMIRVGEVSGTLDDTLDRMARYFETDHKNGEKIKSALVYPVVVGFMSIFVTVFVIVKIVPTFVTAFAQNQATLPLATRMVIAISHFLIRDWWIAVGIVIVILVGDIVARRRAKQYRFRRDGLLLKLPIVGDLQKKLLMGQFSRTLSLLLMSAVPITESVRVARQVVSNEAVAAALENSSNDLAAGNRLSQSLIDSPYIPGLIGEMVAIGEETGNLDTMLEKVADMYETEVASIAERMQALLEPVMILVLAAIVGLIVLAVLAPEFKLIEVIH